MFSFLTPQALHFGRGQAAQAARLAKSFGSNVLLVHGASAARAQWLVDDCTHAGLRLDRVAVKTEPSLPQIESALHRLKETPVDVVLALGGGSALDMAKALAALLPAGGPPIDYLEVVGKGRALDREPLPMIALPTTAGTGAEVTKNAVIAVPDKGLKVSLRDPRMVPDIAIIDAGLMQGAPRRVALSAALDAVTQVIEPYLTRKANPMTDALCLSAIPQGLGALRDLVEHDSAQAWDTMAWVSTCGGLALANAGLGAVHGFAGVIGGQTGAPHGEICGALLPAVLHAHAARAVANTPLAKRIDWVSAQVDAHFSPDLQGGGIAALEAWAQDHGLRGLVELGLAEDQFDKTAREAAGASSMKGNPFDLSQAELVKLLRAAA